MSILRKRGTGPSPHAPPFFAPRDPAHFGKIVLAPPEIDIAHPEFSPLPSLSSE
jgi:hypothetical protein